MNLAMRDNPGIYRQRGFWLRCFLGAGCFLAVVSLVVSSLAWAKVEKPGPLHLWRLNGFFTTGGGKPIVNVEVRLERDGAVVYKTTTDSSGRFAFEHVSGKYVLHIDRSEDYSELSRDVVVGLETAMMLRAKTIYVLSGPGLCTDDCSTVFTSKDDFEKAVRRNTQHR